MWYNKEKWRTKEVRRKVIKTTRVAKGEAHSHRRRTQSERERHGRESQRENSLREREKERWQRVRVKAQLKRKTAVSNRDKTDRETIQKEHS